ncbi:hypothetical protein NX722_14185 [Endozoicomonas gorgoniicola]|uniref:Uncharacterized protein n=1 Tax=Endozoicomonas gorgoniicola TaxID=1234144 RepID=A0ABT3MWJ8_9GAMM|nr:hypothetical protein [Endozoicomonas gorgoniicola]MCW7553759.1 hypothetical protein [Endozoicomonas gorgoniicola]
MMEMGQIFENGLRYLLLFNPVRVHELDKKKIEINVYDYDGRIEAKAFHKTVMALKSREPLSVLVAKSYGTDWGRIIQKITTENSKNFDPETLSYHYHVAAYDLYLTGK